MSDPGKRLKILNKSEIQELRAIARGFIEKVARRLLGNRTLWVASKVRHVEAFQALLGYDAPLPKSQGAPYGVQYIDHNIPDRLTAGTIYGARLTLVNTGGTTWRSNPPEGNCVDLVVHFNTKLLSGHKLPWPEVAPGERVTVHFPLKVPSPPGPYTLRLELMEQKVGPFVDRVPAAPVARRGTNRARRPKVTKSTSSPPASIPFTTNRPWESSEAPTAATTRFSYPGQRGAGCGIPKITSTSITSWGGEACCWGTRMTASGRRS